jgi:hypothetical protein
MPFVSQRQSKWAFATHQPFAKKWADMTDYKSLPDRRAQLVNKAVRLKARNGGKAHGGQ